ncbi:MAG: ABC transporter ATP-binding protein [Gemmatimonadota bacterium]|nr:ABC transporter ATP-binding protein [Gemmatimonadota bacterium]
MIETTRLTRRFGPKVAVQDLDMRVQPGEIVGFLGPNGAGKTTTVKVLTCMIKPSGGSARVAGFDVGQDPMEVKKRVGYVPEAGALYETLTAEEYLGLVANLRGITGSAADTRIREFLGLFGILAARNQRLVEYSKGMRQKVLISAALIANPEVLFLDEPLNGLDANAALVVKELLRELASQGRTILFCSHILEVVERICTRIIIINEGRVITEGRPAEIAAEAGESSLEAAFARITGVRDAADVTRDLLSALGSTPADPARRS